MHEVHCQTVKTKFTPDNPAQVAHIAAHERVRKTLNYLGLNGYESHKAYAIKDLRHA